MRRLAVVVLAAPRPSCGPSSSAAWTCCQPASQIHSCSMRQKKSPRNRLLLRLQTQSLLCPTSCASVMRPAARSGEGGSSPPCDGDPSVQPPAQQKMRDSPARASERSGTSKEYRRRFKCMPSPYGWRFRGFRDFSEEGSGVRPRLGRPLAFHAAMKSRNNVRASSAFMSVKKRPCAARSLGG